MVMGRIPPATVVDYLHKIKQASIITRVSYFNSEVLCYALKFILELLMLQLVLVSFFVHVLVKGRKSEILS